jgi:hypothetical protein
MTFDECHPTGHVKDDPEDYCCTRCEAEQCPVCLAWFPDYDTFTEHSDDRGIYPGRIDA